MGRAAVYTVVFFFLAPGTTAGLVPWLITGWERPDVAVGVPDVLGIGLLALGSTAVIACFVRFVAEGSGTPAPVAPTETLVVGGLYRHVRNPMYLAVAAIIGGQALVLRSGGVLAWWGVFLVSVYAFVRTYEEPTLGRQFGTSYEDYREAVPGWWPRWSAYHGPARPQEGSSPSSWRA